MAPGNQIQLWATEIGAGNASLLASYDNSTQNSAPYFAPAVRNLTADGTSVFFSVRTANGDTQLWTSDGTNTGTKMVSDQLSGFVSNFVVAGGLLYFTTASSSSGIDSDLKLYDATASGSQVLKDFGLTEAESASLAITPTERFT
jgi:ELWxxDGT repeat protein